MVRASIVTVLALALVSLTGCGASQKPVATGPCDYSTPPGELQMTYEAKESAAPPAKGDVATSYRPNAQERPKTGAVHAAVN